MLHAQANFIGDGSFPGNLMPFGVLALLCLLLALVWQRTRGSSKGDSSGGEKITRAEAAPLQAVAEHVRRANNFAGTKLDPSDCAVRVAPTQLALTREPAIVASGERGLGLYTIRPVLLGQLFLAEPALFTAPLDYSSNSSGSLAVAWTQLGQQPGGADQQDDVLNLEDSVSTVGEEAAVPALLLGKKQGGGKTLVGVLQTNCMPDGNTRRRSVREESADAGSQHARSASGRDEEEDVSEAAVYTAGLSAAVAPAPVLDGSGSVHLLACRANHSCTPNAEICFDRTRQCLLLLPCPQIDSESLPEGTEVSISYVDSWCMDFTQRRVALAQRFGFECRCDTCVAQGADAAAADATDSKWSRRAAGGSGVGGSREDFARAVHASSLALPRTPQRLVSDANRRRLASLHSLLPSLRGDPARALDVAQRMLSLLAEEGFGPSSHSARVRTLAAALLRDKPGFEDVALDLARDAMEGFRAHRGPSSPEVAELGNLVQQLEQQIEQQQREEQGLFDDEETTPVQNSAANATQPSRAAGAGAAAEAATEPVLRQRKEKAVAPSS